MSLTSTNDRRSDQSMTPAGRPAKPSSATHATGGALKTSEAASSQAASNVKDSDKTSISKEASSTDPVSASPELLGALASNFASPVPDADAQTVAVKSADLGAGTLRVGMRGDKVKALQEKLNIKADGIFGPETQKAVRAYQKEHNLEADGIVGKQTKGSLQGLTAEDNAKKDGAAEADPGSKTNPAVTTKNAATDNKVTPGTEDTTWTDSLPEKLRPHAQEFIEAGKVTGVDPRFLAAISMQETGNGRSSAFRNKNNAMGISGTGGPKSFSSVGASIRVMAQTLAKPDGYYKGKDTIKGIAGVYAPIGAANDPSGLNSHWHKNVTRNFRLLGGDPSENVK